MSASAATVLQHDQSDIIRWKLTTNDEYLIGSHTKHSSLGVPPHPSYPVFGGYGRHPSANSLDGLYLDMVYR